MTWNAIKRLRPQWWIFWIWTLAMEHNSLKCFWKYARHRRHRQYGFAMRCQRLYLWTLHKRWKLVIAVMLMKSSCPRKMKRVQHRHATGMPHQKHGPWHKSDALSGDDKTRLDTKISKNIMKKSKRTLICTSGLLIFPIIRVPGNPYRSQVHVSAFTTSHIIPLDH